MKEGRDQCRQIIEMRGGDAGKSEMKRAGPTNFQRSFFFGRRLSHSSAVCCGATKQCGVCLESANPCSITKHPCGTARCRTAA